MKVYVGEDKDEITCNTENVHKDDDETVSEEVAQNEKYLENKNPCPNVLQEIQN